MRVKRLTALEIKRCLVLAIGLVVGMAALNEFTAPVVYAAPSATQQRVQLCKENRGFFGLVPWYQYLGDNLTADCDVKCFNVLDQGERPDEPCGDGTSDIPEVLLAIIDDLLRLAALITIGYVMYGAFQYVASQGDPENTARAQKTIISAIIGLALAMTAVAIVSFIGKRLGG
jgi:hypothetical protein